MAKTEQRINAINRELAKKGQGEFEKHTIHFFEIGDTDIPPADGVNVIDFIKVAFGTNGELNDTTDADCP